MRYKETRISLPEPVNLHYRAQALLNKRSLAEHLAAILIDKAADEITGGPQSQFLDMEGSEYEREDGYDAGSSD